MRPKFVGNQANGQSQNGRYKGFLKVWKTKTLKLLLFLYRSNSVIQLFINKYKTWQKTNITDDTNVITIKLIKKLILVSNIYDILVVSSLNFINKI